MVTVRGVSYLSDDVPIATVHGDLRVIREDLQCTAVMIIGTDEEQLALVAEVAVEAGLDVWIRPHLREHPWSDVLPHLERVATDAEQLRARYPVRVTLLVGSEFSHTARGIVPGRWSFLRLMIIMRAHRLLRRRINRKLYVLLDRAESTARQVFKGPVSYSAAGWEEVDWSRFDLVGVSLYRSRSNQATYGRRVAALVQDHDKPVIITDFGCGAFLGADQYGAGSFRIVHWFAAQPTIRGEHPRDEATQASYLVELIDLYTTTGVYGCFAFTFIMRGYPHDDPRLDLDKAGFGIVKVTAADPFRWTPKAAFHAVARRYQAMDASETFG